MSDIESMTRSDRKAGIEVFVTDGVGDLSTDRAMKMLAGFPKHAGEKAVGSAIKRAATTGEAYAARAVRNEYFLTAGDFKKYTKSKRRITTSGGATTVEIEYRGTHIPILRFDTKVGKDGRVMARVKRSGNRSTLDGVFEQTVGKYNHRGIFERVSEQRYPIREIYGPSTPQMMENNDDVAQAIGDKVRETYEERLQHEVTAFLNGWRK